MFCSKCGIEIGNDVKFCPNCGSSTQGGAEMPNLGADTSNVVQESSSAAMGMSWYKFLIYFALFAGAVINVINGFNTLTSSKETGMELAYSMFEGLEALFMGVGIGCLVLAGLQIYTRFRLSGFCENGPKMVVVTYAVAAALNIVQIIGMYAILPSYFIEIMNEQSNTTVTMIVQVVLSVVMLIVNKIYFDKRKHLFVNK